MKTILSYASEGSVQLDNPRNSRFAHLGGGGRGGGDGGGGLGGGDGGGGRGGGRGGGGEGGGEGGGGLGGGLQQSPYFFYNKHH